MGRKRTVNLDLPPKVHVRAGAYYYVDVFNGKRRWVRIPNPHVFDIKGSKNWRWREYLEKRFKSALIGAQQRAKASGIECTITVEDLKTMFRRTKGRCEVSRIPFQLVDPRTPQERALIPSLDRISPGKGYTVENCRLVCYAVNVALSNWGISILERIATGVLNCRRLPQYASGSTGKAEESKPF